MCRRYQWWSFLLLNLNVINMLSNWLGWKAQKKIQVESRFCKTIGCSCITLLSTYLSKKTMFIVNNRNTRKRSLLISKIKLKTSEPRHLTTKLFTGGNCPEPCLRQFFLECIAIMIYYRIYFFQTFLRKFDI